MAMASGEEQLKPLRESEQNLTQLAAFIRGDLGTAATPDAVNQARQYTVDALASVAFQVFSASQALSTKLAAHEQTLPGMDMTLRTLDEQVTMAAFRGGRKEFARFAPPKRDPRVPKMQYLSASEAPQAQAPQTRGFVCRSIDFSSLDNVGKGGVRAPQRAAQPAHGGGSGGQADPYGTSVEPIYGENLPRTAPTQSAPSTPSTPAAASTPTFRAPNNSIYGTVPAVSAFGTAAPVAPPAAPMAPVAPRAPPMAPSVPMAPVGGPSMAPPPPMAPMAPMKPSMGFAPAPSGVAPPPPGVPPPPPTMPAAQPAPAAGGGEPEGEDENFYGVVPLPAADPLYSEVDYGTVQQPSDDNLYGNPIASNTARNEDVSIIALATALYDYEAVQTDELSFPEGARIKIVNKNTDGWFEGILVDTDVRGLFPGNYVEEDDSTA